MGQLCLVLGFTTDFCFFYLLSPDLSLFWRRENFSALLIHFLLLSNNSKRYEIAMLKHYKIFAKNHVSFQSSKGFVIYFQYFPPCSGFRKKNLDVYLLDMMRSRQFRKLK